MRDFFRGAMPQWSLWWWTRETQSFQGLQAPLVGGNMIFLAFHIIIGNNPNSLSYVSGGLKPPTSSRYCLKLRIYRMRLFMIIPPLPLNGSPWKYLCLHFTEHITIWRSKKAMEAVIFTNCESMTHQSPIATGAKPHNWGCIPWNLSVTQTLYMVFGYASQLVSHL